MSSTTLAERIANDSQLVAILRQVIDPTHPMGNLPPTMGLSFLPSDVRQIPEIASCKTLGELRGLVRGISAIVGKRASIRPSAKLLSSPPSVGSYVQPSVSYDPNRESSPTRTQAQYAAFYLVFDHFNQELFGRMLPDTMLVFAKAGKRTLGYYIAERWRGSDAKIPIGEIALCPDHLSRTERETASTIAHEMCHLWQHKYGRHSRRGYHNTEFANRMESIGLIASATGRPGGARTGQRMTHYVVDGGPFDLSFQRLPKGSLLPFVVGTPRTITPLGPEPGEPKPRDPSKLTYICGCGAKMWGKQGLGVIVHEHADGSKGMFICD